jgi:toxin CcdB
MTTAGQFDVYANPNPLTVDSHPYLIVLQSDVLADFNTRIVAPLIAPKQLRFFEKLMPEVVVRGSRYVVDMTNLGPIPVRLLHDRITNLEERRYDLIGAIDLVFTGI